MFLKFIPHMLAKKVGGMPTTETMVRILKVLFYSMFVSPNVASSRN
jgi:hypothetical protein